MNGRSVDEVTGRAGSDTRWRRYPPLTIVVVALALAILTLPSALNLPLANPGQTLEYAPVPGNQASAPPGGNLAGLGLGQSANGPGGVGGQGVGAPPPPPDLLNGVGRQPSTKRCVGSPPRQTEDPMSPPCVAFFEGDNGGATYQGVTPQEVRVVFYLEGNRTSINNSHGSDTTPTNALFDLWSAPTGPEDMYVEWLRVWQAYFYDRYQTYNRKPHFYVYFNGGKDTAAAAQADASENYAQVHPFAELAYGDYGNAYENFMAEHGVLNFGGGVSNTTGSDPHTNAFYSQFPGLVWGFNPSADEQAQLFSSFVCAKIANSPATWSGNPGENGQARRYGLVYSADPSQPGLSYVSRQVTSELAACGVHFVDSASIPVAGNAGPPSNGDVSYAVNNMAKFKRERISTIIWPGGYESNQSAAAAKLNYFPEWITWGGDHVLDEQGDGQVQDQQEWPHTWDVTSDIALPSKGEEGPCVDAYLSVDPTASAQDLSTYTCHTRWSFYDDIRQLFTGIQVAGPRLTPTSMDQGFHAIPQRAGTDPSSPACYYLPGDYTCVKDAMVQWWSGANGSDANSGCYRMTEDGQRFLAGHWPSADLQQPSTDPCNTL